MAVTFPEFVNPRGQIDQVVMFPDDTDEQFAQRIEGYIQDALTLTNIDAAMRAWVYYRAFNDVHIRLASQPTRAELDEGGSYSYLLTQINIMRDRAEEFLAEFNAKNRAVPFVPQYPVSASMSNTYWP